MLCRCGPLVRPPTRPHAALARPYVSERERHVRAERGRSCMATWTTLGLFLILILIIILDYLLVYTSADRVPVNAALEGSAEAQRVVRAINHAVLNA